MRGTLVAKQNRNTLKNYFKDGSLPSAEHFAELIDSTLNIKDEGFKKSDEHGFEISTLGKSMGLVSFFRDSQPLVPLWSIRLDEHGQQDLVFISSAETAEHAISGSETEAGSETGPTLTLKPNGWVGVQTGSPGCDLDISGTMRCKTQLGTVPRRRPDEDDAGGQDDTTVDTPVPADGKWHNITGLLTGCQALEVVAGVGKKGSGHYAMLHAVALNTFNPRGWWFNFLGLKDRIKCRHSCYRSRFDKLALRWHVPKQLADDPERKYVLQIKSKAGYGKPIRINYHITKLWTDPMMTQSWEGGEGS
jgi:hypothetical protein